MRNTVKIICNLLLIHLIAPWSVFQVEGQSHMRHGNITQLSAGTGGSATDFDGELTLLPLVYQQATGTGSFLRSAVPSGALSRYPATITKIGYIAPEFMTQSGNQGILFNVGSALKQTGTLLVPLSVDPEDMQVPTRTWFSWRGVDAMMPLTDTALTVNSNINNDENDPDSSTVIHTTILQIPVLYGLKEGSSWNARLLYEPEYEWIIKGEDPNTLDHFVTFAIGRDHGKSAIGLQQQFSATSNPIAELRTRTERRFYKSRLDYVYEIRPKLLILPGLSYDLQKQLESVTTPATQTESYGAQVDIKFAATPKFNTGVQLRTDRTHTINAITPSHVARARFQYFLSEKLGMETSAGIQLREPEDESDQITQLYDLTLRYNPRIKTVMEFSLERETRPSLIRDGVFIDEMDIDFSIEQAVLLRWVLDLGVQYSIRRLTDDSVSITSGNQNSFTYNGELRYLLSDNSIVSVFFSRNRIRQTVGDNISKQNLYGIRLQYQF